MKKELELYIHIPFCVRKCAYCDFLSGPGDEGTIEAYVDALVREIHAYGPLSAEYRVSTIFLGGGTPSVLSGRQMTTVMEAVFDVFEVDPEAEITMEANPGTVTEENLRTYHELGINRISFGLQSANNEELKVLGRIHTFEQFVESYELARKCGFQNINVDLISAVPGQTRESFRESLQKVLALHPEHISAYSLIIEEGTPFAKLYGEGAPYEDALPSEEEERAIYHETEQVLLEAGYARYEISNYAREGYACKHNLGYWERKEYLGIGLGASSLLGRTRFHHIEDLEQYFLKSHCLEAIRQDVEELSNEEEMEEFFFLGLRKMSGVSKKEYEMLFREAMELRYGNHIERLVQQQLLEECEGRLRLTQKGIDISNYVFAELLA